MTGQMADAAIAKATEFLLRHQSPDGLWRDFTTRAGEAVDWPTGYIADALCGVSRDRGFLARCAEALMTRQHDDGGWGYHERVPSDADSTASVLSFLLRLNVTHPCVDEAARALTRFQTDSGGIRTYKDPSAIGRFIGVQSPGALDGWWQPTVDVTARAGRALKKCGEPYAHAAARTWEYVKEMQSQSGLWEAYWWTSAHYATYEGAALGLEFGDVDASYRAEKWVCQRCVDSEGRLYDSFSPFELALCMLTLNLRKDHESLVQDLGSRLLARQRMDGSWEGTAYLRIPPPRSLTPGAYPPWRRSGPGVGVVTRDHHGYFTTATALAALAAPSASTGRPHETAHHVGGV